MDGVLDDEHRTRPSTPLTCAECGTVADSAAQGWRAYLDDEDTAVLFCPDCAEREFDA